MTTELSAAARRSPSMAAVAEAAGVSMQTVSRVARGYDNATIARRMVLSPKTVRNHVSNVLAKIGASDRAAAMIRARDEGLGGSVET